MFDRVRYQRLFPRGMPGLTCDEEGLALGPVALVVRQRATKGWQYQPVSRDLVERAMTTAYGSAYTPHGSWFYEWLRDIAAKMSAAHHFSARTAAVQIGLPEPSPEAFSRLDDLAQLTKFNPNWAQEARDTHGRGRAAEETPSTQSSPSSAPSHPSV